MKNVDIGFKDGQVIGVRCESVEVEWEGNTIKHMELHGERPKIAFLNTDHIAYVLVGEARNLQRKREDKKITAEDILQSIGTGGKEHGEK